MSRILRVREAGYRLDCNSQDDLKHGTTPAYVHSWVRSECRGHQRVKMATNRG